MSLWQQQKKYSSWLWHVASFSNLKACRLEVAQWKNTANIILQKHLFSWFNWSVVVTAWSHCQESHNGWLTREKDGIHTSIIQRAGICFLKVILIDALYLLMVPVSLGASQVLGATRLVVLVDLNAVLSRWLDEPTSHTVLLDTQYHQYLVTLDDQYHFS